MKSLVKFFKHLFTPHPTNGYRSKIIHHDMLTGYLVFALFLTFAINHLQTKNGSILGYATDITANKLFHLTNQEREKDGLEMLTYSVKLQEAAQKKAENMFLNDYWSHYGPNGETPWQYIFSDGVVRAWMNSPTHKENILRKDYTEVGFAVVDGVLNGEETTLVVQMFAKPLYASVTKTVEHQSGDPVLYAKGETQSITQEANKGSFYSLFVNINVIFFIILISALALDFYFASKLNLIHLKGKNLIHILFLGTLTIGIIFIIQGTII
jgi:hypothetical protein